jgi:hypothetical protein
VLPALPTPCQIGHSPAYRNTPGIFRKKICGIELGCIASAERLHQLYTNLWIAADAGSRYVFMTERRAPMTAAAFQGAEALARRGRQNAFAPI